MKKLLFILCLTFPLVGFCQSYVFCPKIKIEERQGLNDATISIVFKDNRVYSRRVVEKCTKTELFAEFVSCIKQTYPNVKITVLDESKFDENPAKGILTFKIDFQKYDVTFYGGMYIAKTKYEVNIFDYRNGENIIKEIIYGEGRQFNALGFKSGKIASNSSFKEAFDRFIVMLDKQLTPSAIIQKTDQQVKLPQNTITKSKADRLRELKQLLDEKILTQEEYDKEKKKILDENV